MVESYNFCLCSCHNDIFFEICSEKNIKSFLLHSWEASSTIIPPEALTISSISKSSKALFKIDIALSLNSYNIFFFFLIYNDFKLFFKHKFNKIKEFILFPPVKFTIIFLFSIFFFFFSKAILSPSLISKKFNFIFLKFLS